MSHVETTQCECLINVLCNIKPHITLNTFSTSRTIHHHTQVCSTCVSNNANLISMCVRLDLSITTNVCVMMMYNCKVCASVNTLTPSTLNRDIWHHRMQQHMLRVNTDNPHTRHNIQLITQHVAQTHTQCPNATDFWQTTMHCAALINCCVCCAPQTRTTTSIIQHYVCPKYVIADITQS